jgi:adenosylcobinamide-GDP ribazoletransferase
MKQFLIALQFLTILPVKISEIKEKDFGKSLVYFPIVGMLIGLVLVLSLFVFSFLPPLVYAALILVISIIITGGVHLDGIADTCDGFYGSKPKEEILEIMRDSHIGTMGVIGVACLLLLKFTILTGIPREALWKSLIMMTVFARWTQGLASLLSNYARQNGKAKYFIEYADKRGVFMGGLFTLALFLLLASFKGFILFIISLIPIFLFISYIKRRISGMTGDTIGATSEIAEVLILLFCLFLQV